MFTGLVAGLFVDARESGGATGGGAADCVRAGLQWVLGNSSEHHSRSTLVHSCATGSSGRRKTGIRLFGRRRRHLDWPAVRSSALQPA